VKFLSFEYEVAIVGGGPAGSSTSFFTSLNGVSTVLVEKKSIIGTPVKCGEFIPTLENMKKLIPKTEKVEKIYNFISKETISNKTKFIKFYSPNNRPFEFKFEGLVLKRDLLEQTIVKKAEEKGTYVYLSSLVKSVVNNKGFKQVYIKNTNTKTEKMVCSRIIVGADGFPSNVAKWMDMKSGYSRKDLALAIHSKMVNVETEEDTVEMFTGNQYVPGGYAWIIPKGDRIANVGLGVRLSYFHSSKKKTILDFFNLFLKKHPIASKKLSKAHSISFSAKIVPVGGIVKETCKNGALLVGDAAGLVLAINGSGIPLAMLSGYIAGEVISNHIQKGDVLNVYEKYLKKEIGEIVGRSVLYRRIADKLMCSDLLFNGILRIIGVGNVSKVLKCEKLF